MKHFLIFNFGAFVCTPIFYSCYVHLFCRSEQSVSSLNICTADSPPHTGQHISAFVFYCFGSFHRFFLKTCVLVQLETSTLDWTLDNTYQLLYLFFCIFLEIILKDFYIPLRLLYWRNREPPPPSQIFKQATFVIAQTARLGAYFGHFGPFCFLFPKSEEIC